MRDTTVFLASFQGIPNNVLQFETTAKFGLAADLFVLALYFFSFMTGQITFSNDKNRPNDAKDFE